MTDPANPYRPPQVVDTGNSWWERTCRLLRIVFMDPSLLAGDPKIFEGIVFYIEKSNEQVIYAACPSRDFSDQRMALIVSEAVRLFPRFLENEKIAKQLQGRKLCVRLIESYDDPRETCHREHVVELP